MTNPQGSHFKPQSVPNFLAEDAREEEVAGSAPVDAGKTKSQRYGGDDGLAPADELPELPVEEDGVARVRKRRKKPSRTRTALKVLGIIVLLLGVAAGGAALWVTNAVKAGEEKMADATEEKAKDAEETVEYNGKAYKRNKDIVAIAVIGFDSTSSSRAKGMAGQADTNMVAALDTKTGKVKVIAVPRDSMVTVDQYSGETYLGQTTSQLCLQFGYGDGGPTSAQHQVDAISRVLLNMPIAYYFAIDMTGIATINDSIGGVELTPTQTIPGSGVVEGQAMTLWGSDAYDYLHWRDTSVDDSSLSRQARQEQYLKAFAAKLLSNASAVDISSFVNLYNTALSYSVTNLGFDEFSYLATVVAGSGVGQIDVTALTGTLTRNGTYMEYYLDESSVEQAVIDTFYTPVKASRATEDAE